MPIHMDTISPCNFSDHFLILCIIHLDSPPYFLVLFLIEYQHHMFWSKWTNWTKMPIHMDKTLSCNFSGHFLILCKFHLDSLPYFLVLFLIAAQHHRFWSRWTNWTRIPKHRDKTSPYSFSGQLLILCMFHLDSPPYFLVLFLIVAQHRKFWSMLTNQTKIPIHMDKTLTCNFSDHFLILYIFHHIVPFDFYFLFVFDFQRHMFWSMMTNWTKKTIYNQLQIHVQWYTHC